MIGKTNVYDNEVNNEGKNPDTAQFFSEKNSLQIIQSLGWNEIKTTQRLTHSWITRILVVFTALLDKATVNNVIRWMHYYKTLPDK